MTVGKRIFSLGLLLVIFFTLAFPQAPKREFRAVWLATVQGLDWPQAGASAQQQEESLRGIIRRSEAMGMNAVVFQVVSRGDAMFPSERLPWAPWLSGSPGINPGWDPLAVAIEECHRLGMELHAWYNVYRIGDASTPVNSGAEPLHVRFAHPDWVETVGNDYWLNPAIPGLREWLIGNVREIVEKYDIDAIHFDFIRYNTNGYTRDQDLFQQPEYNPDNIQVLGDWRRENINKFVRAVHAAVQGMKPWVKIGSAPVGHYKPTAQINWPAFWGYDAVFQDSRRWLREQVHDYVAPQIYWAIGLPNPRFELLARDWTNEKHGRHVYVGIGAYQPGVFPEIPAEIDTTRNAGADGHVYFRYANINTQPSPFGTRYQHKALPPVMGWKDSLAPNPSLNLRYEPLVAGAPPVLRWDVPSAASDGDTASRYVVYRLTTPTAQQSDFDDPANILSLAGQTTYSPPIPSSNGPWYFAVSALDRNYNESPTGNILSVIPPAHPVLAMPAADAMNLPPTMEFTWHASPLAALYHLQVSTDSAFASNILLDSRNLVDTATAATGFTGQARYFWRLAAANAGGTSSFSSFRSFTTGFPATPSLASPANASPDITVDPTLIWRSTQGSESFRLQLSTSSDFTVIVKDTAGIQDTSLAVTGLAGSKIHFWRIGATNSIGTSLWSDVWRFRTSSVSFAGEEGQVPRTYDLSQNYPNPFNPITTIRFVLPAEGQTTLRVFDVLGREVALLVHETLPAGVHQARFDASLLPSGTYLYVLTSGSARLSKKMIVLK